MEKSRIFTMILAASLCSVTIFMVSFNISSEDVGSEDNDAPQPISLEKGIAVMDLNADDPFHSIDFSRSVSDVVAGEAIVINLPSNFYLLKDDLRTLYDSGIPIVAFNMLSAHHFSEITSSVSYSGDCQVYAIWKSTKTGNGLSCNVDCIDRQVSLSRAIELIESH